MVVKRGGFLAVTATATIALLSAGVPDASAQTLMDFLRGNSERRAQREAPPVAAPPPAPVRRAAPPRITGPQYYTYKTDSLVRVDFSAIRPEQQEQESALPQSEIDPRPVGSTQADGVEEEAVTVELEPAPLAISANEVPNEPARSFLTESQISALQDFELLAEKEAAEAIVEHYSQMPELMWVSDGQPNARAADLKAIFADAASHGLNPADYAVQQPPAGSDEAATIAFEMELTARLLRYVRDAQNGRIDPNRISGYYDFKPKELDRAAILSALREAPDVTAFIDAQHPQNTRYQALRVELAELRVAAENDIVVAPDTLVRPGQTNTEFPKILALIDRQADAAFREAHGELLTENLGSETYTQTLVPLIKAAQKAAGVGDDGIIGPRTVQAIAGDSRASRIEKVEIAMEQLRWLPSDLSDRYVFLNTPSFDAVYVEDGEEKLVMDTIVGNTGTQTYFFQDEISYVEFHPYWGMPRSILVNSYLSRVINDPTYFDRNGFEVVNQQGQRVSSTAINWSQYGANIPYNVRQRPGRNNALGEMKIMFPNRHAIYMHDTPDKHLFSRENRALSNGCIRLVDPRAMAAAVLGWDRNRVDTRLEGQHGRENLSVKVPVYVAYFTAWPDQSGEVNYYNDVYSRDEKVRAAIDKVEALRTPAA